MNRSGIDWLGASRQVALPSADVAAVRSRTDDCSMTRRQRRDGETPAERRERLAAGARMVRAAKRAWVKDHPGHTAADCDHWGSCSATPQQNGAGSTGVTRSPRDTAPARDGEL